VGKSGKKKHGKIHEKWRNSMKIYEKWRFLMVSIYILCEEKNAFVNGVGTQKKLRF
jgi:hypothetical protein